jgi:hypothetical protein
VWRGWESVATFAVLAVMLVGIAAGSHVVSGIGIVLIGGLALYWAMTRGHRGLRRRLRESDGPGGPMGQLISLVPGLGARLALYVMCFAVIALGVLEIAGG